MTEVPASPPPQPRKPSRLQWLIEHCISYAIIIPAIANFLLFVLALIVSSFYMSPAEALLQAFNLSVRVLFSSYILGLLPAIITGLISYPLWKQFREEWQFYLLLALLSCSLYTVACYMMVSTVPAYVLLSGFIGAIAAFIATLMTRRLRKAYL
ncbi:hypothetical protein WJT86_06170 [Microvirga sp. W0021]|uniref:Uncharacterized protein n=1 Tax=Hohaiivirga grylli TaxID=3133970 RepID=A0ABV0BM78_9HYPH